MRLLDRYIARAYLANIAILFAALFSFVVVVDVFLNLENYLSVAKGLRPGSEGVALLAATALLIVDLWGPRLLQLFTHLSGFVLLVAMGFTCAHFVRRREFLAALASGQSLRRIGAPFFAVAIGVLALSAANQEFILPRIGDLLPRGVHEAGQRSLDAISARFVRDGAGRVLFATSFEPETSSLTGVHVWERDDDGRVLRRISADSAVWDGAAWSLTNGRVERPGRPNLTATIERLETDLEPRLILLSQVRGYGQALSWRSIHDILAHSPGLSPDVRRRLDRVRFGRLALMASALLTLLIASSFFLVRMPQSMLVQGLKCAPIGAAGLIFSVLGVAEPLPGVPVALAVFVPTIILAPIAVWSVTSLRT